MEFMCSFPVLTALLVVAAIGPILWVIIKEK